MLPERTPQPGHPLSEGSWCLTLLAPSSLWWVDSRTWVSAGFRSGANSESGAFIGCLLSPCLTSPFPTGMSRDWLSGEILAPTGASSGECTTGTYLELSLLGLSLVSSATEAPLRCPSPCCFLRQQVSEIFLLPSSPSCYFWLPKPLSSGQYGTAGAAGVLAGNSMLKPGILRSTFKGVGRKLPEVAQERAHSSPGVWGHRHPGSEGEGKVPTGSCEDRNPTGAVDSGSQRQPAFVRLKLRNMYSSTILFPPSVYCQCAQGTRLKVRGPRRHWCCPHPSAPWVERRSEELRVDLEGPVEGSSTARLLLWEEHAASKGPLQVRPQAQRHMHSDLWTLCPQEGCVQAFVYVCAHTLAW